jgi:hypothetical protein
MYCASECFPSMGLRCGLVFASALAEGLQQTMMVAWIIP